MNVYEIVFNIGSSVFERAIDPKFFIEDLRELGRLEVDIILDNVPAPEDDITPEHGFEAIVKLESDSSLEEIEEELEFILNEGVTVTLLSKDENLKKELKDTQEEEIPQNLLSNYFIESKEVISRLDREISKLNDYPDDRELINELFRDFHTLKGGTGVILSYQNISYLDKLKSLAHSCEGLLHRARDGSISLNSEDVETLQVAVDRIDDLLSGYQNSEEVNLSEVDDLISDLSMDRFNTSKDSKTKSDLKLKALREVTNQYFPIYEDIFERGAIQEDEVEFLKNSLDTISKMKESEVIDGLRESLDYIFEHIESESDHKIAIEELKSLHKIVDAHLLKSKTSKNIKKSDDKSLSKYVSKSTTLRINESVINQLMDLVGEVSVFKEWINFFIQRLAKHYESPEASKDLKEQYQRFKNLVNSMQTIVLDMRMVPLTTLFERFPKLVRDLSRSLGKRIDFKEEGGDTLLDKVIIEKIGEPMVHLIRNSIDHGVETPQRRVELNKSESGELVIRAYQLTGSVYIEIIDDGAGVDSEIVRDIALKKGLVSEEQLLNMSESDINQLIFLPGFSTKEKATEISGRGVGTDAILSAVKEIGGDITLQTELNKGTKITLELPLTLAMQKILLCRVGESIYGVPADFVSEIVKIERSEISYYRDLHIFFHRGDAVRIEYASRRLNLDIDESEDEVTLLIDSSKRRAIAVTSLLNTIDSVVKPIPDIISSISEITGVTILGDGTIVYIVTF